MPTLRSSRGRPIKRVNYAELSVSGKTSEVHSSEEDEDAPIATTQKVKPMKMKKKQKKTQTTSSSKPKPKKRRIPSPPPSDEDSDDDLVILNEKRTTSRKRKKTTAASPVPKKKRRLSAAPLAPPPLAPLTESDGESESEMLISTQTKKTKRATAKGKRTKKPPPEKRSARYRSSCPQKTRDRISRARSQRLFMISATIVNDLCRSYAVLGSTGNVYDVVIGKKPQCSCPDFGKGNLCKHILFVMLKVLRVDPASPHVYQRGLLSTELQEIFENAPATLIGSNVVANQDVRKQYATATGEDVDMEPEKEVERKEHVGNDCPVCMDEFEEDEKENLVWCKAQCGQNIHAQCFDMWANNARNRGEEVTCVYCRAKWIEDANRKKVPQRPQDKVKFNEGYMNFGQQQGLSSYRDTSSYHSRYDSDFYYRGRYGRRRWGYSYW